MTTPSDESLLLASAVADLLGFRLHTRSGVDWEQFSGAARRIQRALQEYADEAVAAEREAVLRMIAECEGDIDFLKFKLRARAESEALEQPTTAATAATKGVPRT